MVFFSQNISIESEIESHLTRVNALFKPELKSYVDIPFYAHKIFQKAIRYEVFDNEELVGLLAVYTSINMGFVTNFSLEKKYLGQGLSNILLNNCISDLKSMNIYLLKLEVYKENHRAIKFYMKNNFEIESEDLVKLTLIRHL